MAQEHLPPGKKHRLEIYYRIGQRMRTGPLLAGLIGLVLLAYTYLIDLPKILPFTLGMVTKLPPSIAEILWRGVVYRPLVFGLIALSGAFYAMSLYISRASVVQARPDHLYVRAGLVPLAISYARVRSLRPVRVAEMYPRASLRGRDRALLEPFMGETAAAVDMHSYPMNEKLLRRLWGQFMFATDRKGLMLLVRNYMELVQEIDAHRQRYMDRKSRREVPRDVFERVAAQKRRR